MASHSRFSSQRRVALPGSTRQPFELDAGTGITGKAKVLDATETISTSVIVYPKEPLDQSRLGRPDYRLTRSEFVKRHGPHPDALSLIEAFAEEFDLQINKPRHAGPCTLHLTGTLAALQHAFGVSLSMRELNGEHYRVREGDIQLPEELSGHIVAVLGLDNRPQARTHFRIATPHASNISYTPVQVAQLYGFPVSASGAGQTVGLIEFGGGFRQSDLNTYFNKLGLPAPVPAVVSVDSGTNSPGTASGADGEVMLDIEVSAAVAPGTNIATYFAPNTDQGFVDAISTAVHDTVNKPTVISISWGGPESSWTAQAMTALDSACQAAAALGVTIIVACGDNGSTDGVAGTANHVDFPASSPHVLACGGTTLKSNGSTIASEVVWNETAIGEGATGGGVSTVFALPSWQANSHVPSSTTSSGGRGVPDVAGDADPSTGYSVEVDGEALVIGGTSAVAPLWAGLIALANAQNKTSAGFVNPTLYESTNVKAFRDITQGKNGAFSAGPGWDACSGLGSPNGALIIQSLAKGLGT